MLMQKGECGDVVVDPSWIYFEDIALSFPTTREREAVSAITSSLDKRQWSAHRQAAEKGLGSSGVF
jgi:hypothetical protein